MLLVGAHTSSNHTVVATPNDPYDRQCLRTLGGAKRLTSVKELYLFVFELSKGCVGGLFELLLCDTEVELRTEPRGTLISRYFPVLLHLAVSASDYAPCTQTAVALWSVILKGLYPVIEDLIAYISVRVRISPRVVLTSKASQEVNGDENADPERGAKVYKGITKDQWKMVRLWIERSRLSILTKTNLLIRRGLL